MLNKQTKKDRKCLDCDFMMSYAPRIVRCLDCYKKKLNSMEPPARANQPNKNTDINLFIPED